MFVHLYNMCMHGGQFFVFREPEVVFFFSTGNFRCQLSVVTAILQYTAPYLSSRALSVISCFTSWADPHTRQLKFQHWLDMAQPAITPPPLLSPSLVLYLLLCVCDVSTMWCPLCLLCLTLLLYLISEMFDIFALDQSSASIPLNVDRWICAYVGNFCSFLHLLLLFCCCVDRLHPLS